MIYSRLFSFGQNTCYIDLPFIESLKNWHLDVFCRTDILNMLDMLVCVWLEERQYRQHLSVI